MPTVEERYAAATAYVRRAVATVENRGVAYTVDPITGFVEWYAGRTKTQPACDELSHTEARWLRASSDIERARVARDAELLADRVQETLPGAPQDRQRTNLYKGETPTATPATSYYGEASNQAGEVWGWIKDKASGAADDARSLGTWLLLGGGVVLGWKLVDYLRERERRPDRDTDTRRALNASLERAAESRNAKLGGFGPDSMCPVCHRYKNLDENGKVEPHEYPSGGMCPGEGRLPLWPHGRPRERRRKR